MKFFDTKKKLENIVNKAISAELFAEINSIITEYPILKTYLYNNLLDEKWFSYLKEKSFKTPPEIIKSSNGVRYPSWPESYYLVRIAGVASREVAEVILNIPYTENQRVHTNYWKAMARMPASISKLLVYKEIEYLKKQKNLLYVDESVVTIIKIFCEAGFTECALKFVHAFLDFHESEPRLYDYVKEVKPTAKVESWEYQNLIESILPVFLEYDKNSAFKLFVEQLLHYITIENQNKPQDYTYVSRPDIEINRTPSIDILDVLIDSIIQTSEKIIESEPDKLSEIYNELEKQEWHIFRRIAFYLVGMHDKLELVEKILMNLALIIELITGLVMRLRLFPH